MEKINNIKKAVIAYKEYYKVTNNGSKDILGQNNKVYLDITFKRIPVNQDYYCHTIGPLPYPTNFLNEISICLIVRDLNPSKKLKDRDLDLKKTKDYYVNILEKSGLHFKIMKNITILPIRELFNEYKEYRFKNKLATSFDLLLVDWKLMNNKYKFLQVFLGSSFYERIKKIPIPVKLNEETEIKKNLLKAICSTNFYISGNGISSSILIGRVDFKTINLAKNLKFIVKKLEKDYNDLISILKICGPKSKGFAFFADLRNISTDEFIKKFPINKHLKRKIKIDKQFKNIDSNEEISDIELEVQDGTHEIVRKKVRFEDISIF